jgi:carboxyl-terminal processing protease
LQPDIPMVVLVNQYSASGSEVVGGALQDTGRAPLFGTRTYGKGSVNHIRELSDGSALYITSERWLTPKGNLIEGKGLTPDVLVDRTQEDVKAERDPQLDKAIEYLETTFLGESSGARGVFPAVPLVLALPG